MRNLRNKNAPPLADLVQYFIDSAYDTVKLVADNLGVIIEVGDAINSGTLENIVYLEDIDTFVELNAIVQDEELATEAYVDNAVTGLYEFMGGYDASTNTPDLTTSPNTYEVAQSWQVTGAGTFFGVNVEPGDQLTAIVDNPTVEADWSIVNRNIDSAAFATAEQGVKADTALQPGQVDNVSELINDANYADDQTPSEIATGYNTVTPVVSQVDAEAGISTTAERWTPQRVAQAIAAQAVGATTLDDLTDVDTDKSKAPADGDVLTYDGTHWNAEEASGGGGGGGGMTALYKDANYTASADELIYSESGLTHQLPASPTDGDKVSFWDVSDNGGTNAITIDANGHVIGGVPAVYLPGMMTFASGAYYNKTSLTLNANYRTLVFRINRGAYTDNANEVLFISRKDTPTNHFDLLVDAFGTSYSDSSVAGRMRFYLSDTSGTAICNLATSTNLFDGADHTVFFAYDAVTGSAVLYVDGVNGDDLSYTSRTLTTGTLNTGIEVFVGGVGSSNTYTGEISYLGLDETYLTNPTDFYHPTNGLQELDETGWTEWGSQPLVWQGEADLSVENLGSIGLFTKNGTITGPNGNNSTPDTGAITFSLNMNGGRVDFMYNVDRWIYSYVVQTIQPSSTITRVIRKTLRPNIDLVTGSSGTGPHVVTLGKQYITGSQEVDIFGFTTVANYRRCFTQFDFPDNWLGRIRARFVWSPTTTNTNIVKFQLRVEGIDEDGVVTGLICAANPEDPGAGVAGGVQVSPWSDWDGNRNTFSPTHSFYGYFQTLPNGGTDNNDQKDLIAVEYEYEVEETLTAAVSNNPNTVSRNMTGTTDTLLASDAGKVIYASNALAQDLGIPDGLPVGMQFILAWEGVGEPSVSMNGSETIVGDIAPAVQYKRLHVEKRDATTWWGTA
jgi:hypothetical protein